MGRRAAAAGVLAAALTVSPAGIARADVSTAGAIAVELTLLVGTLITSGTATATNDGSSPDVVTSQTPSAALLGQQNAITVGVLAQTAVAYADGGSAACAGLVGAGGTVSVAEDGTCATSGTANGIQISLAGLATIQADAIVATCSAASDGTVTASAKLVNAKVVALGVTLLSILNVADITVGHVECGPTIVTLPTPALPWPAIPVAVGIVVLAAMSPPGRRLLGAGRELVRPVSP